MTGRRRADGCADRCAHGCADDRHADVGARERGGILALTLGALGVAAVLIVVIAVAGALYLDRRELLALADATAADAATAIDPVSYAAGDVILTDASVRAAAAEFLAGTPTTATLTDPTGTPDGATAEVTLTVLSRPSFLPWALIGWSDGISIEVTASARGGG